MSKTIDKKIEKKKQKTVGYIEEASLLSDAEILVLKNIKINKKGHIFIHSSKSAKIVV